MEVFLLVLLREAAHPQETCRQRQGAKGRSEEIFFRAIHGIEVQLAPAETYVDFS
jgi:hypothetical protein